MAVTFFPSNPAQSAAVQAQFGANASVDVARLRIEEAKAIAQAQAQQRNQENFWRSQQFQQANDLNRQQLASEDFFRRGQLGNQEKQIAANLEANKSRDAATDAWRKMQMQPQLDRAAALQAGEAQDTAMLGTQLSNLAKVRTEYDRLTADLSKLSAMETAQTEQAKLPEAPTLMSRMTKGTMGNLVAGPIPRFFGADVGGAYKTDGFKPQATTADGRKIPAMDLAPTRDRLQKQLSQLADIIKGNQDLTSMLTKAPDGSWVPSLPSTPAPSAQFFNTPATNAPVIAPPMTNAPTGQFFNSPAAGTNLPPIIKFDPRSGRPIAYDAVTKAPIGYAN